MNVNPLKIKTTLNRRESGFTLVEIIISIVLAGIIAVGVIQVSGSIVGKSANPLVNYQAVSIAESYLDEIMSRDFMRDINIVTNPDCTPPASRALYTSICHYNGLNDVGATDQNGIGISGLGAYNVTVAVTQMAIGEGTPDEIPALDSQRVVVTVTGPDNITVVMSAYRTNI